MRGTIKEPLKAMRDTEVEQMSGAGQQERSEGRKDTLAGHYERALETRAGHVSLVVPKLLRQTLVNEPCRAIGSSSNFG